MPARLINAMFPAVWSWRDTCLFVALYVAVDWATYIPTISPLGVTPWNPSIGLGFALLVLRGASFAPLVTVASLATDIVVRKLPFDWWVTGFDAVLIGAGYAVAAHFLGRPHLQFDKSLSSMRDLALLSATAAAAAAGVAIAYTAVLVLADQMPLSLFLESAIRYWIGDLIGIAGIVPFVLLAMARRVRLEATRELAVQAIVILLVVLAVFGLSGRYDIELFYLLLLPIVWIAVRSGLEGASFALVLMQISIMIALHIVGRHPDDVAATQTMLVAMAVSGLTVGVLISEQARTERRLRLQQDAIARAARLGSMGQLATALAHELNQPLTAASNYSRATIGAMSKDPPALADARDAATKTLVQIERSAQVIRRLRDLIQIGRIEVEPHRIERIIQESLDIMQPDLVRSGTAVSVSIALGLPRVAVDLLQIEQVLTNLLRNAIEALSEAQTPQPSVAIAAKARDAGMVELTVTDNGPGFPPGFRLASEMPAQTSKSHGLGVGLSLCQSIVVAHGGEMTLDAVSDGARVRFTLPSVEKDE